MTTARKLSTMDHDTKVEFGKRFKKARLDKGFSRQALGDAIGVNIKTIQSWEFGRTFIQDLGLLPSIEATLGLSVGARLDQASQKRSPL